ncbi:MAG: C39 family peptidase [Parvularculaceae bacterium]
MFVFRRRRSHGPIVAALAGAALGIFGGASAQSAFFNVAGADVRLPVQSVQARKFETVVRQQFDFSCGSAALATLLTHHYERPTGERDVFSAMWEIGDRERIKTVGFSLFEMKAYAESVGLVADGFKLTLDRIATIGVPGIALIEDNGYRHFVVVKGINERRVLVGDPALGVRLMSRKRFLDIWDGTILFIRSDLSTGKANFNKLEDWRLAPTSPFDRGLDVETLQGVVLNQTRPSSSGFSILRPEGF